MMSSEEADWESIGELTTRAAPLSVLLPSKLPSSRGIADRIDCDGTRFLKLLDNGSCGFRFFVQGGSDETPICSCSSSFQPAHSGSWVQGFRSLLQNRDDVDAARRVVGCPERHSSASWLSRRQRTGLGLVRGVAS